jgi:hypothetical protein
MFDTDNPSQHDLQSSTPRREEVVSKEPLLSALEWIERKLELLLKRKQRHPTDEPGDFSEELPPLR